MKARFGLTLIELLVTLAIIAITSAIVLPSFSSIQNTLRTDAKIKELNSTIRLARNHAISYGVRVSVCPLINNCCGDDWQNRISVFTDPDANDCFDSNDELIAELPSVHNGDTLTFSRQSLRFLPDGLASGYNGTFRYCSSSYINQDSKAIIISNAGRSRVSKNNVKCE